MFLMLDCSSINDIFNLPENTNYDEDENLSKSEIFEQPWNNPSDEVYSIKFRLKY